MVRRDPQLQGVCLIRFALDFALAIAIIGEISSAVFLVLAILGALHFHSDARKQRRAAAETQNWPPVSVLKPVHGLEANLKENLESFFRQDYPDYEILFAADEPDDAAIGVIREVAARYPGVRCQTLVTGKPPWPNPPAYCFYRMSETAAHDILITSDSDVEVAPNYLREIVAPLLDLKTGMVTCMYRGKNVAGFWSGQTAIGMSVEMTAGVLVANLLEGMKFGLGPTIAVRRAALEKIGGYSTLGEYFANDFMIGNLIVKAGYRVVLSGHIIDHVVSQPTFRKMWENQLRWAKSTRYSRPYGHLGHGLIFAMPYGILGFAAAALLGHAAMGVALLGIALLNRVIEAWVVGWGVVRDRVARNEVWLYPVRDLLGFVVWCASYTAARAVWRDSRYELKGDRIVLRKAADSGANLSQK